MSSIFDPFSQEALVRKLKYDKQAPSCHSCPGRACSIFNKLDGAELLKLDQEKTIKSFKTGETIYEEGFHTLYLLCVSKGKVKIVKNGSSGNEQVVDLKGPVDFLGFSAMMEEVNHHNSAIALEDTEVCFIKKEKFFEVLSNNPTLAITIMKNLAKSVKLAQKRSLDLSQKQLRARLADALLMLNEVYGCSEGAVLNVKVKRSDLAAIANMNTANAIRVLSSFAKEGLVALQGKQIILSDLPKLRYLATFSGK